MTATESTTGQTGRARRGPGRNTGATRQRIVAESARLFADRGYHATGVADISRAAGLGSGALYHHMGSKEEILLEICRPHVIEVLARGEAIQCSDEPALQKLRKLARVHMEMIATRTLELRVSLRELDSFTGSNKIEMRQLRDRTEAVWDAIVADGLRRGELAGVDPLFVKAVLGALNYAVLWFHEGGALSSDEVADRIIALMLGE